MSDLSNEIARRYLETRNSDSRQFPPFESKELNDKSWMTLGLRIAYDLYREKVLSGEMTSEEFVTGMEKYFADNIPHYHANNDYSDKPSE